MSHGMPAKTAFAAAALLALLLAFFAWYLVSLHRSREVFDTVQITNGRFGIRVKAYKTGGYMVGGYYVFESRAPQGSWNKFMSFRHDDRILIPHDHVRFIDDSKAFVFLGWKYAVTTDSGKTWNVWEPDNNQSGWRRCAYDYLIAATVNRDGSGVLSLNSRCAPPSRLRTTDYGRHWQ